MEWLFLLAAVSALAIAYKCRSQSRQLTAAQSDISRRDTEIARLQEELRESIASRDASEALLAAYAGVSFDLALILDEESRIVSCNRAAQDLFGARDVAGMHLSQALDSPELNAIVRFALEKEDSLEEQFKLDAAWYRAKTAATALADGRRYIGVALQDITDLVNLNRARRDLVANISHELRTPITRIRLIIEGLFLDADRPKRKASIQSLKEIAMETDALLWLSQELLDLSMIESGEAIMRLVPLPLKPLVDDAIERLRTQAEMKNLRMVSRMPRDASVLCDGDQLRRVLGNLLHNAIKWSPPGDAITITASESADEIRVSVFDNGPGVPEDLRERVFERFYQADVSRSGDEGTGLGLAICKHIVEAHGGEIWAEGNGNVPGGHFVFTLLKAESLAAPETSPQQAVDAVRA